MCENWGFERLAKHNYDESIDEMKDAEKVIERILYLEGVPNLQRLGSVLVGETVPEQHRRDLQLEQAAGGWYNRGVAMAREEVDNGTVEQPEGLLTGEGHPAEHGRT